MLKQKWMGQFERQRQKTGNTKSKKGGRPPKVKDAVDRGPGIRITADMNGIYLQSFFFISEFQLFFYR